MTQTIDLQNPRNKHFFLAAALCAFLSAVTTCILIFVEVPRNPDILEQAALANNATYLFRTWTYFFHPLFAIVSIIGLFLAYQNRNPGLAMTALIFFILWAFTEALQQALALDALNQYWRPMLLNASDEETRTTALYLLKGFDGLYDSFYFLLLFAFAIGSTLMGLLLLKGSLLERVIAITMIYFGLLSLISFFGYYAPWPAVSGFVNWSYQWIYPTLQPVARVLIAWLLLSQSLSITAKQNP